jgi:hypothetical protein
MAEKTGFSDGQAKHVVDLGSNRVLAAEVYPADPTDGAAQLESVTTTQINLARAGSEADIEEVAADKGYHKVQMLTDCADEGLRTHIPEPKRIRQKREFFNGLLAIHRGPGEHCKAHRGFIIFRESLTSSAACRAVAPCPSA